MTSSGKSHLDEAHRQMLELLPWLVNGSLVGDERRHLERHLADCPECRVERATVERLAAAVRASEDLPLSMENSLAALRRRVASQSGETAERPVTGVQRWLRRRRVQYRTSPAIRRLATATPWALAAVLARRGLRIPFRGMRDADSGSLGG